MRILALVTMLLAAPAIANAQAALLSPGPRSALIIQGGADLSQFDQKAANTTLIRYVDAQPWGAVTGVFNAGARTSFMAGIRWAYVTGTVDNLAPFAVLPGNTAYGSWKHKGHVFGLQLGTIIWLK